LNVYVGVVTMCQEFYLFVISTRFQLNISCSLGYIQLTFEGILKTFCCVLPRKLNTYPVGKNIHIRGTVSLISVCR
jgi:hypothetical protein